MDLLVEKIKHTYEDYLKLPDDKRYELIEGELIMTPSPVPMHQRIVGKLFFAIKSFLIKNNFGEVFIAPLDVYFDDENVVQPDIIFISNDRKEIIKDKNIQGAPDLVIEILSEATAYRDLIIKKKVYEKYGVKECWIVAPEHKVVEIYFLKNGQFSTLKTYNEKDTLESEVIAGLKINLNEIFSDN